MNTCAGYLLEEHALTENAVKYTVERLMAIACPELYMDMEVSYISVDEVSVSYFYSEILFKVCTLGEFKLLVDGIYPMRHIPSFDGEEQIPVMLQENQSFAYKVENKLIINADIITLTFLLLSRGEELFSDERDEYGRFRYEQSLSAKYGFVDVPLVDEYAMLLRKQLKQLLPNFDLGSHKFSILPTHDMDSARRFLDFLTSLKSILGGDLFLRKSPLIALQSIKQYLKSRKNPAVDPELLGAEMLLEQSKALGLTSEFYFMGIEKGEEDFRYCVSVEAVVKFAVRAEESGMKCGFHGSKLTSIDAERLSLEKKRMETALGHSIWCGRQHYLCFDAVRTPDLWEEKGIKLDSTLGFNDREGFRCGTCYEYPLYNLKDDCALSVVERPLLVMDVTLSSRGHSVETAKSSVEHIISRCIAVGGQFVILWHNGNIFREWWPWYNDLYVPVLTKAAKSLGR